MTQALLHGAARLGRLCLGAALAVALTATPAWADEDNPLAPPAGEEGAPPPTNEPAPAPEAPPAAEEGASEEGAPEETAPKEAPAPQAEPRPAPSNAAPAPAPSTPRARNTGPRRAPGPAPVPAGGETNTPPKESPAPAVAPPKEEWSSPAADAQRALPDQDLPAPMVRDPRRPHRTPVTAPSTRPRTPDTSASARNPSVGTRDNLPVPPPQTRSGTAAGGGMTDGIGRIQKLDKQHNVTLPGGHVALRLDVEFAVQRLAGTDVWLEAQFARSDTRKPLAAILPDYADASGHVAVSTQAVRVARDGRFGAALVVPYATFPRAADATHYTIVCTVTLVRRDANGRRAVLASSPTTFSVHAGP